MHDLPSTSFQTWFFQYVFAISTATIVSGAVAERITMLTYVLCEPPYHHPHVIHGFLAFVLLATQFCVLHRPRTVLPANYLLGSRRSCCQGCDFPHIYRVWLCQISKHAQAFCALSSDPAVCTVPNFSVPCRCILPDILGVPCVVTLGLGHFR